MEKEREQQLSEFQAIKDTQSQKKKKIPYWLSIAFTFGKQFHFFP